MRLHCAQCGQPIDAADVNLDKEIAKCRACHAVFGFSLTPEDDAGTERRARRRGRERPEVPMPAGISVEDDGASLRLVRRWFSLKLIPLLFFCIAWDAFLVFWYSLALAPSTSMNGGGVPWIMIVFPIAHVAVGVGLTYSTLAGFLNRTQVRLEPGRLSIRHGPLPWLGNQVLDSSELDQVFCRRRDSTGRHGTNVTYEVRAIMKGGKLIKLLSGLEDEDQALYLEQQIERRLGIADRAVPGELEP